MMKPVFTRFIWPVSLIAVFIAVLLISSCSPSNQPPVITNLTASEERVNPSDRSQFKCVASDPDGDELEYNWSASEGSISGEGSIVTWTAPKTPGSYTITVEVKDGRGGKEIARANIGVAVNHPPVIKSLTAEQSTIKQAMSTAIECVASDPDGDELSYAWSSIAGNFSGKGSAVTWTAPNSCATYTISVTISDGRGGKETEKLDIKVAKPG
ncbi:MAG: Ig-like domain-containing protein [Chloroflexota bacterium]